nr:deoxyribodipyrimidine photo-lyase-like [Lytechinus pictus]
MISFSFQGLKLGYHQQFCKQKVVTLYRFLSSHSFCSIMGKDGETSKRSHEGQDDGETGSVKKVKKEENEAEPQDLQAKVANLRKAAGSSILNFKFNKKRVRILSDTMDTADDHQGIVYWMSRDQRVQDNWALLFAQRLAMKQEVPLHVCFCLVPKFLDGTIRHYNFLLEGLKEVSQELHQLDIPFHLLTGYAKDVLPGFIKGHGLGAVVTDFSPLRTPRQWVNDVKDELPKNIAFCQVDAHNVVPCWEASEKLEYGARTIRPKITKQLTTYLTEFPPVVCHPFEVKTKAEPIDWEAAYASLDVDQTVKPVDWAQPGTSEGMKMLDSFTKERLRYFSSARNDPTKNVCSNLSPWIHFGQLSSQRAALIVRLYRSRYSESVAGYLEESIVRRELSDNFCFYNDNYDSIEGTNEWAKKTLKDHAKDKREYVYSRDILERAKTHDQLWNSAQVIPFITNIGPFSQRLTDGQFLLQVCYQTIKLNDFNIIHSVVY